jgi:hypothetical protein
LRALPALGLFNDDVLINGAEDILKSRIKELLTKGMLKSLGKSIGTTMAITTVENLFDFKKNNPKFR